jgi:hypothetical protein
MSPQGQTANPADRPELICPEGLRRLFDEIDEGRFEHANALLVGGSVAHPEGAFELLAASTEEPPANLFPIAAVDESSLACVVCAPAELAEAAAGGFVVRWHLGEVPPDRQAALLDVDPVAYVTSLDEELGARDAGLVRMLDEIGPGYQSAYLSHEKRPRDFVVRPVRIACQNVIVGLAAIAQEASFDGLTVVAWQTCEVPHVATHEANRALAALILCDAFQNGGTMEIRFDRPAQVTVGSKGFSYDGHPEGRVPASLRRYGRTAGIELGAEDQGAIFPAEARELFLAVTPMRPSLRARAEGAIENRGMSPERLCFALLSGIWREIELDWLLGAPDLATSVLAGGADWRQRPIRQAEMEVCRTALMAGMLFARLDGRDGASVDEGPRVVEDQRVGVDWEIDPELGAVRFSGRELGEPLPWLPGAVKDPAEPLLVLPRSVITAEFETTVERLAGEGPVAVVVPRDVPVPELAGGLVMRCPDRLSDLDKAVEAKLLTARISRG